MTDTICSSRVLAKWSSSRCSRNAVVFVKGKGYCKQHSPTSDEKERQAIRDARADFDWCVRFYSPLFFKALLNIAKGASDPRETAQKAIELVVGKDVP